MADSMTENHARTPSNPDPIKSSSNNPAPPATLPGLVNAAPTSSPIPLLRPPIPGQRGPTGRGPPRLGLSIPSSPAQKQVNPTTGATTGSDAPSLNPYPISSRPPASSSRPGPPRLQLATPHGSSSIPYSGIMPSVGGTASAGGESARSRESSFGQDASASSGGSGSYIGGRGGLGGGLSLNTMGGGGGRGGTPDPASAISTYSEHNVADMARQASNGASTGASGGGDQNGGPPLLPDLAALRLERGRDLDVDDLDDEGWMAASKDGLIEELGTLGEGAGGAVKRCRLKGGKTVFALKVITTDPDPDMQKQIRRELEFNKRIADIHICRYYGAYGDNSSGVISIIMEYCEGGSLDAVYREVKKLSGRIGEKVLGKVAEGSLQGLTYLYSKKIIHRDIKPSNILLCRDGTVKLCDFGVSGEFGTRGDANTFIGTSYYMAPERITGQSYNITSDVWSLGVTLLEVAQHRFPFGDESGVGGEGPPGLIDIIQYIVAKPLPRLIDEDGKDGEGAIVWSENFKEFIDRCLERDSTRRATPWRMLEHPWMEDMKMKKVNMGRFLQQVWGWDS